MKKSIKLILLLGLSITNMAWAVDVNIMIRGEIVIPPCKINGNSPIDLSFGKIAGYKVDGQNYALTKSVNVECDYYEGTPYIKIGGGLLSGASNNVLHVNDMSSSGNNIGVLGIALYQGGSVNSSNPLVIGSGEQGKFGYKVKTGLSGRQFTFTAVPYKHGSTELVAGAFNASATMNIYYL
jgi:minor pilin subunit PapF